GIAKLREQITSNISVVYGHEAYIEPQCFKNEKYIRNQKSDIYAIGVLLWELTSGRRPFKGLERLAIILKIQRNEREQPIHGTPEPYINLYRKCWDEDPKKRPTLNDILLTLSEIRWDVITETTEGTEIENISISDITYDDITFTQQFNEISQDIHSTKLEDESIQFLNNVTLEITKILEFDLDDREKKWKKIEQILKTNDDQGESVFSLL